MSGSRGGDVAGKRMLAISENSQHGVASRIHPLLFHCMALTQSHEAREEAEPSCTALSSRMATSLPTSMHGARMRRRMGEARGLRTFLKLPLGLRPEARRYGR